MGFYFESHLRSSRRHPKLCPGSGAKLLLHVYPFHKPKTQTLYGSGMTRESLIAGDQYVMTLLVLSRIDVWPLTLVWGTEFKNKFRKWFVLSIVSHSEDPPQQELCGRPRIVDALVRGERCDALPLLRRSARGA